MNKKQTIYCTIAFLMAITGGCKQSAHSIRGIGSGMVLTSVRNGGGYGLLIEQNGKVKLSQPNPLQVEVYLDSLNILTQEVPYGSVEVSANCLIATATAKPSEGMEFEVTDLWQVVDSALHCTRNVKVKSNSKGGFLTAISFVASGKYNRQQTEIFVPGMIYGGTGNLSAMSIGGKENFKDGYGNIFIREDRMPAPLFGMFFNDGFRLTVLDPKPDGRTSLADAHDITVKTIIDSAMQFGSMGASIQPDAFAVGFKFPGSEGDITYQGNTYPEGQKKQWRRRYHPVAKGFEQNYSVAFRFSGETSFPEFYTNSWRWAWNTLKPQVLHNDIVLIEKCLIDLLSSKISTTNGITGIPATDYADANTVNGPYNGCALGFVSRVLEVSDFLLQDADENPAEAGRKHHKQAEDLINTCIRLIKLSPPGGVGYSMDKGELFGSESYLREFTDDFTSFLKTVRREKRNGVEHGDWVLWVKSFADWLLPQQYENGGFPRSWESGTGKVIKDSPKSSYNPIPFLLLLSDLTGDEKYAHAAVKAGEFCWSTQNQGLFAGGTLDNPDVVDKEAGTLSLEAYLALFEYTRDEKWMDRAQMAANFAETWIYIWNVPMTADDDDSKLHWKKGVSTIGVQLISTGHSLVDQYMAYEPDEYAMLFKNTGDRHYYDVARILLHNTKNMVAVPGRLFDLKGPGWQQEHWSLAPERGYGLHRGAPCFVSTSHLNGIKGLKELDSKLFEELCN